MKMWISFMIPKIEDGNNFGVSVQEDTLAEVQSVESEAAAFFDQISRYFVSRGNYKQPLKHFRCGLVYFKVNYGCLLAIYFLTILLLNILLLHSDTLLPNQIFGFNSTFLGKLISKVAKYPHIDDYRRAVQELDEKEYLSLWLVMSEIRNRYCALHDIVLKNIDKIKKPRTSNATESLY